MIRRMNLQDLGVFLLIWLGQLASVTGSGLTGFALSVWIYDRTGSVTQYALILLFATLPGVIVAPLVGALVDRWNRRTAMLLGEAGAALATLLMALLLMAGQLQLWQICLARTIISISTTFQWVAYTAAIPLIVPKRHLGRANGLVQFALAIGQIVAPLLAGAFLVFIEIQWLLLLDVLTFLFAILTLLLVRIPEPAPASASATNTRSLRAEMAYGWQYIVSRPGLLGLLIFIAIVNLINSMVQVLLSPFVLSAMTAQNLAVILSSAGFGLLAGSIIMSIWGGGQRRTRIILGSTLVQGIVLLFAGLPLSLILAVFIATTYMFNFPVIISSGQAIWQSKVAPAVQGKVFATRRMIATLTIPLAYLLAGPLADQLFKPLLLADGPLAGSVGRVIGTGPGRGMAFLFVVLGLLMIIATAVAYWSPRLRRVEEELPDTLADQPSDQSTGVVPETAMPDAA